ncbi:MAG: 2-C-methyl-D-erythritol 4-phosphate cytidylyltransferase [Peptococcaceae bacterium]|nr:2-C-methyl-D-erythritol 4-phosphate cytidylyltransferase [Peptococcaceae bacterium]
MVGAVILAGGQGKRMQAGMNKQYLTIEGRSVLSCAIESMAAMAEALIVVAAKGEETKAWAAVAESGVDSKRVQVVEGGKERQDSVRHALTAMPECWDKVLIHDGARPFVPKDMLVRILTATAPGIGVVPGLSVTDTIKRIDASGFIVETPPRAQLRAAQTPQCFMAQEIRALHLAAVNSGHIFTDDAALYEYGGKRVRMVDGDAMSRKLTVPDDMLWAVEMKHAWEAQKK